MRIQFYLPLLAVLLSSSLPAAAAVDYSKDQDTNNSASDPLQCYNHAMFGFNLAFDTHVAKPFISAYDVIPEDGRRSISNFLTNLNEPLNTLHGILQGSPKIAFTSFWRFILNTTFGLGGLRDFAREQGGLHNMDQNLGITMGRWGVGAGPYIVLPIYGPSSARDTVGRVGDWFLDPLGWAMTVPENVAEEVMDGVDSRDRNAGVIEHLYYQSLDPYVATRSAYRQHEFFKANTQD